PRRVRRQSCPWVNRSRANPPHQQDMPHMTTPEPDTPESAPNGDDLQQGLFSHLLELRSRLLKSIAAVVLVLLALVPFANRLYTQLAAPLVARLPEGAHLIATGVTSPFITPLKLALYALLFAAMGLFYLGCAFAYFLVLPAAFRFLVAVTPNGVEMMTDISQYLDFV